jgi:hypothetical protein
MLAAVLEKPDAAEAQLLVPIQPLVDGIWVTRFQQAVASNRVRRLSIGNFQQGRTAFTDIRAWVMIAMVL